MFVATQAGHRLQDFLVQSCTSQTRSTVQSTAGLGKYGSGFGPSSTLVVVHPVQQDSPSGVADGEESAVRTESHGVYQVEG